MNPKPVFSNTNRKALRDLNPETRNVQVALDQTQSAISHALRLVEHDYQRRRMSIINTPDEEIYA